MRIQAWAANSSGEETVKDFTLHGLEQLLDKLPTLSGMQAARRAGLLWEALRGLKDKHFSGIYRWFYCKPCMCKFDAAFVLQLNETPWVPGPDGQLERPEFVIFDTLGWEPNLFLQSKIRFKAPISETLARELGLEPAMFDELKKRGITSRAELVARLGEEPEQPNGQPSSRNVDDPVKNILGDMPGPTPPAPDPMSPELQGWGGGSDAGWGTESAGGGGTPCIHAAAGSKTGGKSSTTGSGAGKRTPSSAGGRPFISYVGAHPDDKESDPDSLGQSARMALEEQAIANILLHEPRLTRTPINNPGFDLIESSPDGNPVRWVEVKAMTGSLQEDRPVGLSRTQFECAREHGGSYWLYAVEHADDDRARIVRIQDPAGKVRTFTFDHGWVAVAIVDADQEDSEE